MRAPRPIRWTAALGAALLVACSCGPGAKVQASSAADPPDLAARWGYSAPLHPGLTYQPDVVVVPHGAEAIVSASSDGLTWTLKRSATGVNRLKIGSILFATSRAVGRVVALSDSPSGRSVQLAPISLTDVIKDGTIKVDEPLSPSNVYYQAVPGMPGAESTPSPADLGSASPVVPSTTAPPGPSGSALPAGRALILTSATPTPPTLPSVQKSSFTLPVGSWLVAPYVQTGKIGLSVTYKPLKLSLKASVDAAFTTKDLHVSSSLDIRNGQVDQSGLIITGITGLQVSLAVGASAGSLDNSKVTIQVPIEIDVPIPPSPATGGIPLDVKVTYTFSIATALTGNNSTLLAAGKYGLSGPIGIQGDGTILKPAFSVQQSIMDSLSGITIGPSGVVFAMSLKWLTGLGTPEATVGPYGTVTTSLGLTNGSSLAATLVRCKGATLDIKAGAGVGLSLSPALFEGLKGLLPSGTKLDLGIEKSTTLLHRSQVSPDLPICAG